MFALAIIVILEILTFGFWFGVGALLVWLLSLVGLLEFNLLYAVIFAIIVEIVMTVAGAVGKNS